LGGAQQEPSYETNPQSVEEIAGERLPDTNEDEKISEELARSRSDSSGSLIAPRVLPDDCSKDPTAIEWEPWDQVEKR
jgi:hypothetical protein